jgi:hypothetical protein
MGAPLGQVEARVRRILKEIAQCDYYEMRTRLIDEWGVTPKCWASYMHHVQKYQERANKSLITREKTMQRIRLEALYPQCFKTDEDGNDKVDIKAALAIMERQSKLDGLDAPTKQEVATDLTLLNALGINQVPPGGSQNAP